MPCIKRGRTIPWNAWKFKLWLCYIFLLWTLIFDLVIGNSQEDFYVSEDKPSGTVIGVITNGLPFLVVSPVHQALEFSTSTGTIKTKTTLDREGLDKYTFALLTSTGQFVKVIVYVNDVNDNSPTFSRSVNEFTPYEGRANVKLTFSAADPDNGINSTQHYDIISGNAGDVFELRTIQDAKGFYAELVLAPGKALDRETVDRYLLNISARDGGSSPRFGYTLVNVTVLDLDDNAPVFTPKEFYANVSEGTRWGTGFLNVSASDLDVGLNAEIEYSIERGAHSDPDFVFVVNRATGIIRNNHLLDYETKKNYKIYVVARNPYSGHNAVAKVVIRVLDDNDNNPSIEVKFERQGRYQVLEDAAISTTVARIYTTDRDSGSNGEVDVTLEGGNGHFSARSSPQVDYILVARKLDRENQRAFYLKVLATDRGQVPRTEVFNFILNVGDVNDNSPFFDQSVYSVVVSENVTVNSLVVNTHASDKDDGTNSELIYSIFDDPLNSKFRNWFKIDPSSGKIVTTTSLDREEITHGVLHVHVRDKGTQSLSANCTVNINITDSNDNSPSFNQTVYQESVVEDSLLGTMVVQVFAKDPDTGVNGRLQYFIEFDQSKYPNFPFHMDSGSGVITTSGTVDHEQDSSYRFTVGARDGGGRRVSVDMTVLVTDLNDNKPIFNPLNYTVEYLEDIPIGYVICIVKATDRDSGRFSQILYEIVQGNNMGLFAINGTSGVIYLDKELDREKDDSHTLKIQATDGEGKSADSAATVTVTVKDVNDAPPVFEKSLYNFSTVENAQPVLVGSVYASSDDIGVNAQIFYQIKAGNVEDAFLIEPNGTIYLQKAIDHENVPKVVLVVEAKDGGQPPLFGYTNVSVAVIDLNDNSPSFESPEISVKVREDTKVGQTFYTVSAKDPDSGEFGTVTYSFLSNPNTTFKMDAQTGSLSIQHTRGFEWPSIYTVEILAKDGGLPPRNSTVKLKLSVVDVNDHAPVFEKSSYSANVSEMTSANSKVLKVTASDQDTGANARISYSFNPTSGAGDFDVRADGWIYTRSKLDRETHSIYNLIVVAKDHGNPGKSSTAKVTVYVGDVNDNDPQFIGSPYTFLVKEGESNRTFVGAVSATDSDAGRNARLSYKFETRTAEFVISSSTGEIKTNQVLDREKNPLHQLMVVVSDAGVNPRTEKTKVSVVVKDVNDNSPIFVKKSFEKKVYENIKAQSAIISISANDADEGSNGRVRYSIVSGDKSIFQIDGQSGLITLKSTLDREKTEVHMLSIIAQDQGIPTRDNITWVTIYVLDMNDNAPHFLNNSFFVNVPEKLAVGSEVTAVTANDVDEGDNGKVHYVIDSGNSGDTFRINATSGRIYLQGKLDYEGRKKYQLKVVASDFGQHAKSSVIFVTVYVLDTNDNRPTFKDNPMAATVKESVPINYTVTVVRADDADSDMNSMIHYSITSQFPGPPCFKIDPTSGQVKTTRTLDYESVDQYVLIVKAEDQAFNKEDRLSSTATLVVIVQDVNDNKPRFVSTNVTYVMEDEPFSFPVLDILALDRDSKKNGRVEYHLASGIQREFSLDISSGRLILNDDLDHETKSKYVLNVTATDKGKPQLSSFQLLTIYVVDVNDNAPKFVNRSFVGRVAEDTSPGASVVLVSAVDLDSGSNGQLTFSISSGAWRDKFIIDGSTGLLTTKVSLDREQKEHYSFTVTVTDNAFPFRVDTASVQVYVLDKNDHRPVFDPNVQSLHVAENKQLANFHFFLAQDRDVGSNAEVEYTLTMGNEDNNFQIDRSTGGLSTVNRLDREVKSRYFLQVQANNVQPPYFKATVNVTIHVTDSNDNNPKFKEPSYQTTISELTKPYTKILTVTATDADVGTNGAVVYSLSSGAQGFFRIEPTSGDVYSLQPISYEQKNEFNFDCIAADQGVHVRTSSASVKVLIKDENNHAPKFTVIPYQNPIALNAFGTVLTVQAIDGDSDNNAKITYSMNTTLTSQEGMKFFSLDSKGEVRTKTISRPDGRYILYITATDGGSPPLSGHGVIEILVGTVNDDPPKFLNSSPSFVSVLENSRDGTPVSQLKANKDQVTYSIIDGDPENAFRIDSATGLLTGAHSLKLDYEKVRVFQLDLVVTLRSSSLNGYMKLFVNLTDENDNAPQLYPANVSLSLEENNSSGNFAAKTIINLTASDEDSGNNAQVTYGIESGNDDDVFRIDRREGTLTQIKPVDHEGKDFYELVIKATDHGKPPLSGRTFFRVTIVDLNDNQPIFYGPSVVNISENQQRGSEVATLSAKDADEDSDLVYAFQPGSLSKDVFNIDQFTGAITLLKTLDYEAIKHYTLDVSVSDGVFYTKKTLTMDVLDVNDNIPRFLNSSYEVTLSKDTVAGEPLIQVTAEDADSGLNGEVRYMFLTTAKGLKVDPISGVISTTSRIRPRNVPHTVLVSAKDLGSPSQSNVVQVLIQIDGNPTFSKSRYDAMVPENTKWGTVVETVNATGDTRWGRINYKIISGDNFQDFRIGVRTGVIKVIRTLDYETTKSYLLVVSAENGDSFARVTVNITVADFNDNVPEFVDKQYSAELKEDVPVGTEVVTVSANDRDSGAGGRIRYSIQSGNDRDSFEIHPTSGLLTTKAELDHESIKRHQLSVEATDQGTPPRSQVVPVSIRVLDLNDNSPIFVIPNAEDVSVAENSAVGTLVYTVFAEDRDSGSNGRVSYSITGGTGRGLFIINEQTGDLTTNATFDYETQMLYSMELRAVDASVPPLDGNLTLNVLIKSVDEYKPRFQSKDYKFEVPGNAVVGTVIGQVSASDEDGGQDGKVYYSLDRASTDTFAINSTSGEIYVNRKLEAKARKRRSAEELANRPRRVRRSSDPERINLDVVASSGRPNSMKDTVLVKVDVDFACPGCSTGGPNGGTTEYSSQAINLIAGLGVLASVLVIGIIVALAVCFVRRKKRRHPNRTQRETFDGSFDEITVHQTPNGIANHVDSSLETLPPARRISHQNDYTPVNGPIDPSPSGQRTDSSGTPNSASSSGRGSTEGDGEYGIVNDVGSVNSENNGKTTIPDSGIQQDADQVSQVTISDGESSILHGDVYSTERYDKILARLESQESLHVFGEEGGGEADGGVNHRHLLNAKLAEVDADEDESIIDGPQPYADEGRGQPSYGGSLSSIVGSQEELTVSYNWDHLLDWGPKFQPLADVFLEIGLMKDEAPPKAAGMRLSIPSSRGVRPLEPSGIRTTDMLSSVSSLPRSPISPPSTQYTSPAFSPNFTPAITPLVTRSPSVSPLASGISTPARFSLHGSTPHLSRPSSMNVARLRRDSQTSELTHSPSISDNESNLEVDV